MLLNNHAVNEEVLNGGDSGEGSILTIGKVIRQRSTGIGSFLTVGKSIITTAQAHSLITVEKIIIGI